MTKDAPSLRKELEMYQQLSHPHIVSYLGHEVRDGQLCIFLEYMSEGSLKEKLAEFGAFQEDLCCALARQILLSLEYLHSMRVLHRDLKCSNLLLDVSGRVKISDFGCSRWITVGDEAKTLIGSPWWLPPELLRGEAYGPSADIWSFGCTIIELLTAKAPWTNQISADHPIAAAHQILRLAADGEPPGADVNRLSAECRDFVWGNCLKMQATERQSSTQLLAHPWLRTGADDSELGTDPLGPSRLLVRQ